jgi:hypothetical protein
VVFTRNGLVLVGERIEQFRRGAAARVDEAEAFGVERLVADALREGGGCGARIAGRWSRVAGYWVAGSDRMPPLRG